MRLLGERLSPFQLDSVLVGIARIAGLLKTWQNQPDFGADRALVRRFLPSYYPAIRRLCEERPDRLTFTRLGLLYVAKHACRVCSLDGGSVGNDEAAEQILSCCLLANDLVLERMPTPADTIADKAANLLPFSNYVPGNSYPMDLARNLLLIEEIAPRLAGRSDYVDVGALFENATGIGPLQFCELAFGAATKFITRVDEQMLDSSPFVLDRGYFRDAGVSERDVGLFLDRLSATPGVLHEQAARDSAGADFLMFQRHPLIEFAAGAYVCPDPGFLLDKAGPSLYWTLHEASGRSGGLLAYWAGMIEFYVNWLFEEAYRGRGQIYTGPLFADGTQACDLCLVEGSSLIMFEVKASVLTTRAKYSFSSETLMAELHKKAITGEDGERKGVAQLTRNLGRFLAGDDIRGVSRDGIKTIYPLLVFLDHGFTAPGLNRIYNEHFDRRQFRQYRRCTITPMFSLTVEDLENALSHTHEVNFSAILDSYSRANPARFGELSHSSVPVLQGKVPGPNPVRERFERFGEELAEHFFGV